MTYNMLKSALMISPQKNNRKEQENVSTMLSLLFSGGYNSTAGDVGSTGRSS